MNHLSPLHTSMTVRAEDLQIGDRFNHENCLSAVQTIVLSETDAILRLEIFVLGRCVPRLAKLPKDELVNIVRNS